MAANGKHGILYYLLQGTQIYTLLSITTFLALWLPVAPHVISKLLPWPTAPRKRSGDYCRWPPGHRDFASKRCIKIKLGILQPTGENSCDPPPTHLGCSTAWGAKKLKDVQRHLPLMSCPNIGDVDGGVTESISAPVEIGSLVPVLLIMFWYILDPKKHNSCLNKSLPNFTFSSSKRG